MNSLLSRCRRATRALSLGFPAGCVLAALVPAFAPHAQAQTFTWQGPGGSTTAPITGPWNTAGNWFQNAVPPSSATTELDFNSGAAYTSTDNISGVFQLNIITLGTGAGTSSAIIAASAGSSLSLVSNGGTLPVINQGSNAQFSITAPLSLTNNVTLQGTGTGLLYLSGTLSGSGSLTKTSSGQLNITIASNSYGGGTIQKTGTISVQASGALGMGAVTLGGSAPKLQFYNNQTQTNDINVVNGVANGGTSINSALEAANNVTLSGNISVASGANLGLQGGGTALGIITNAITGAGSLTKQNATGAGWLLQGNNTYTGTTSIPGGVLAITGTTSGQGNYAVSNNPGTGTTGTLTGNGTIGLVSGGTLTVTGLSTAQATVSPSVPTTTILNSGIGTLSLVWAASNAANKATFGNYSTLAIDVGASGSSDRLVVGTSTITGALTLGGTNSTLALTSGTGAFDGSSYVIARYFGTLTGTFPVLTVDGTTQASATSLTANGFTYNLNYGVVDPAGGFDITLTTVPEPATWVGALVLLGFGCAHRRGRSIVRAAILRSSRM